MGFTIKDGIVFLDGKEFGVAEEVVDPRVTELMRVIEENIDKKAYPDEDLDYNHLSKYIVERIYTNDELNMILNASVLTCTTNKFGLSAVRKVVIDVSKTYGGYKSLSESETQIENLIKLNPQELWMKQFGLDLDYSGVRLLKRTVERYFLDDMVMQISTALKINNDEPKAVSEHYAGMGLPSITLKKLSPELEVHIYDKDEMMMRLGRALSKALGIESPLYERLEFNRWKPPKDMSNQFLVAFYPPKEVYNEPFINRGIKLNANIVLTMSKFPGNKEIVNEQMKTEIEKLSNKGYKAEKLDLPTERETRIIYATKSH